MHLVLYVVWALVGLYTWLTGCWSMAEFNRCLGYSPAPEYLRFSPILPLHLLLGPVGFVCVLIAFREVRFTPPTRRSVA